MSKNEPKDRQTVKNELTSAIRQSKKERRAITTELNGGYAYDVKR